MTDTVSTTLVDEAAAQIERLMSFQRRAFCASMPHRELSLPQLHIMLLLREDGRVTVSTLAHMLHISPPSASALLDRMEERDLVVRSRDVDDRRVVHVDLSEHGRSVVDELSGMKRDQMLRLLGSMTGDELQDLVRGVKAVASAVTRLQVTRPDGDCAHHCS